MKVTAVERGYFDGMVRNPGDVFSMPDALFKPPHNPPSWVKSTLFDGKGDHDGDGLVGGSKPAAPAGDDLDAMTKAQLLDYAKAHGVEVAAAAAKADVLATIKASMADPGEAFGDAPAPQTVKHVRAKNEANDATGATEPDWVPPGSSTPKPAAD